MNIYCTRVLNVKTYPIYRVHLYPSIRPKIGYLVRAETAIEVPDCQGTFLDNRATMTFVRKTRILPR